MPEHEIEALRERWEANPSPVLTLQLADEYKARNEAAKALEVLTMGAAAHPEHVATRVAKGRQHLELGEAAEAAQDLEWVAVDDPAHLPANKLLFDAYVGVGNLDRARDRLGLCALLSAGDPDLEMMEIRLEDAARAPAAAGLGADDAVERLLEPLETDSPMDSPPAFEASTDLDLEPSSDLEPEPVSEPEPAPEPPAAAEPFELPAAREAEALSPEAPAPKASRPQRVEVAAGDPFTLSELAPVDDSGYRQALFAEGLFDGTAAGEVETAAAGSEERDLAATLTLAELYRNQGHHAEAASIFREILERQPGNARAARALGELSRGKEWTLKAEDLLGGSGDAPAGSAAKELLERYRKRLRPGE